MPEMAIKIMSTNFETGKIPLDSANNNLRCF